VSRAATSRLKVNPPLGTLPTLEWRPVGELRIAPSYQRSIQAANSQTLIRRIAMFWDWGLCQPLAVAKRADGSLMVVDGQHRLEAARLRGDVPHLPCVITCYANEGDEAAAFVALNQQRRPLTALDLFKAAVAAEDETALAITRLLAEAGLLLAPHTNYTFWKPGMLANIARIRECYRVNGEKITGGALEAVARGFQGQVLRFIGTIFPGIVGFLAEEKREGRSVSRSRLADTLNSLTQKEWKALINAEQARLGCRYQTAAKVAVAGRYAITGAGPAQLVEKPTPVVEQISPAVILDVGEIGWCDQCDRKVSGQRAAACTDRHCSMRKAQAA
jgi:hypothetical protein